ncbi:MAG: T9SS type A sorting domain-containing protein [Bacteroidales bacterium]|jgi:hypothetical protein|nr:T9SS type A sorting domain-containing protein [Bacteroidales bacterium]
MRKLVLFLAFLGLISFNLFAQLQVEVKRVDASSHHSFISNVVSGDSFSVQASPYEDVNFYFTLKNSDINSKTYKIRKTQLNLATNGEGETSANICAPSTTETPDGQCLPGVETLNFILLSNEEALTFLEYYHGSNPGTSTVELTIYSAPTWEQATANDKFTFTIIFTTDPISTSTFSANRNIFSIFPNPASNSFTVSADFNAKTSIEVYNVLGKQIFKANPKSGNVLNIDCSKWDKGYYFCRLLNDNKVSKTLKLVVTK